MAEDNLNDQAKQYSDKMGDLSAQFKYINRNIEEMGRGLEGSNIAMDLLSESARGLGRSLGENKDILDKIKEGEISYSEAKKLQLEAEERANQLSSEREELIKKLATMSEGADKEKLEAMNRQMKKMEDIAKEEADSLNDASDLAKKGQSRIADGFDKMGGFLSKMGLSNASKEIGKMAANTRKTKIAGGGLAKMFDGPVAGALSKLGKTNPFLIMLGLITSIVKLVLEVNSEVAKLGRDLGVSGEAAARVRQHFVNIAHAVNEFGVEYKQIAESAGHLNEALGTSANIISGDVLGGMAMLQHRMKLTAEATVGFGKAALMSGESVDSIAESAVKGAKATEEEFGVRVDLNKVLEKTGKIGGQLRGIYGANFQLLSKSVAKAQLLGMELSEVASNSKQMLNFHSSIENEMKAELFLGKQLNLEQARLASLTGDYDTYMEEIRKNAGDFYEFSKMNVLQQNALAGALGMSTDSLADMLMQEEDLLALKERARAEGDKQTLQYLEQQSAQEAFQAALEKMKMLFVNIAANIENMRIPGWMARMMGNKDLAGKRLMDLHNEESIKKASAKLTGVTADQSIYDTETISGGRRAPSLPFQATGIREKIGGDNGGWTQEEKAALINGTYANKTITQTKFGTKNNTDYTKFSYGPKY